MHKLYLCSVLPGGFDTGKTEDRETNNFKTSETMFKTQRLHVALNLCNIMIIKEPDMYVSSVNSRKC